MNTTTFNLNHLADKPKKAEAKTATVKKTTPKREKPHWTVAFFKHADALGDELRKHGKKL